ncbi:peptidoglycan recognition protein family protein [Streptomyces sp. CB01580]|uniref:peptidoglycan recognition protein family protein n=1 Tax=Streptomyces sp. CB01580 TaxID=1703933 RepID=UPI0009394A46|nr:N-acetylmuramoyl-L-alanine amidase [Streptomyces sp. CB01580]
MATPLSAAAILTALRAEGVRVVEVGNWRTHSRNSKGPWGPVNGSIVHHTVTKGTASTVAMCRTGYASLPGPLCHGMIAKDGRVHMVGWGRTNHAGGGDARVLDQVVAESYGSRPAPPTKGNANGSDGNARFYGWECENLGDGKDPWPAAQYDAIVRVQAALCRAHGWTAKSVIGHLEWSADKIDPRGFSMAQLRADVGERLKHPANWNPNDEDEPAPTRPAPTPTKPTAPKPKPYVAPAFPAGLAPGRRTPSARGLQRALKAAGYMAAGIPEADTYGPATQAAVARFHQAHPVYRARGVHYDPAIGPRGWAALHTIAYGGKK